MLDVFVCCILEPLIWPKHPTLQLIEISAGRQADLVNPKIKKCDIWQDVARIITESGFVVTAVQVLIRFFSCSSCKHNILHNCIRKVVLSMRLVTNIM